MPSASGDQYEISYGAQRAVITQVGATLRTYHHGDRAVLWGFDVDEMCSGGRGQILCPWPNRLDGGAFNFEGTSGAAALDEPSRNNAIHGLVRWMAFAIEAIDAATLRCRVELLLPQPAYPFHLDVTVDYHLGKEGLVVTTTLSNHDERRVPVGLGFHPYLMAGEEGVDAATITVSAKRHLLLDDRGLPVADESTEAFFGARQINAVQGEFALRSIVLDDCFTELARDLHGQWEVVVSSEGLRTVLWGDEAFGYVMCFTGDTLEAHQRRRAIAVEAMTCPPNGLASGTDLIVLDPAATFTCRWGIRPA